MCKLLGLRGEKHGLLSYAHNVYSWEKKRVLFWRHLPEHQDSHSRLCFVNWLFIQYVSENEERATLIHFCKFRNI